MKLDLLFYAAFDGNSSGAHATFTENATQCARKTIRTLGAFRGTRNKLRLFQACSASSMLTRSYAQASPSVTLETGISRLRPAYPKVPSNLRKEDPYRTLLPTKDEHRAAAILASVAFLTLLSVCLALYLMNRNSRWELNSLQFFFSPKLAFSSPARVELLDSYLKPLPEPRLQEYATLAPYSELRHASEQYVSYLPHSGFNNQRIALENALVLAYILNRTLLIPPIRLGDPPIRYRASKRLRVDVALSSQVGLVHCADVDGAMPVPEECTDFWTYAQVPWEWLVNLAPATRQHDIRFLHRQDLTDAFLASLDVTTEDTFFFDDTTPYQFRFFDRVEDIAPIGPRYAKRINLPELAERARPYRLLQFGTLFGTTRLHLADPVHAAVRRDIRRAMVFANPTLLAHAGTVRDSNALGGKWGYAAVHLRLGDGVFADRNSTFRNVRQAWWRLVRELGVSEDDAAEIEGLDGDLVREPPLPLSRDAASPRVFRQPSPPGFRTECGESIHPLMCLPLYIATDMPGHPALAIFKRTFHCIYFLANFSQLLENVPASQGSPRTSETVAAQISSPLPAFGDSSAPPTRFLAPFLDALIASNARVVVGTPGSTFSQFVEDVLWRKYHDLEIVERG